MLIMNKINMKNKKQLEINEPGNSIVLKIRYLSFIIQSTLVIMKTNFWLPQLYWCHIIRNLPLCAFIINKVIAYNLLFNKY